MTCLEKAPVWQQKVDWWLPRGQWEQGWAELGPADGHVLQLDDDDGCPL